MEGAGGAEGEARVAAKEAEVEEARAEGAKAGEEEVERAVAVQAVVEERARHEASMTTGVYFACAVISLQPATAQHTGSETAPAAS